MLVTMVTKLWRDKVVSEYNESEQSFKLFVSALSHILFIISVIINNAHLTMYYKDQAEAMTETNH